MRANRGREKIETTPFSFIRSLSLDATSRTAGHAKLNLLGGHAAVEKRGNFVVSMMMVPHAISMRHSIGSGGSSSWESCNRNSIRGGRKRLMHSVQLLFFIWLHQLLLVHNFVFVWVRQQISILRLVVHTRNMNKVRSDAGWRRR